MTRTPYRLFHASNALVCVTGLVYAWMKYIAQPTDPYAVVHHPWQPHVQHLHVLTAPLLVALVAVFWHAHATVHRAAGVREGRRSGMLIWWMAVPMIASGYFIQTSVGEGWRQTWVAVHLATSALWVLGLLAHVFSHRRRE